MHFFVLLLSIFFVLKATALITWKEEASTNAEQISLVLHSDIFFPPFCIWWILFDVMLRAVLLSGMAAGGGF